MARTRARGNPRARPHVPAEGPRRARAASWRAAAGRGGADGVTAWATGGQGYSPNSVTAVIYASYDRPRKAGADWPPEGRETPGNSCVGSDFGAMEMTSRSTRSSPVRHVPQPDRHRRHWSRAVVTVQSRDPPSRAPSRVRSGGPAGVSSPAPIGGRTARSGRSNTDGPFCRRRAFSYFPKTCFDPLT
ncbi:hypothetical protein ACTIVE_9030 [Actinomadura verrucosospora]|uniref:Uncharacterized protein n=1 Tax=Actinomadura verrucosospora TaxID=46165 RepID=A0A7D3VZ27_ACTVE|nr:hypothetical protein ACTIVE_9030 [Actinomadura verrucosospora]